jgi:hypothetical protein
LRLALLLVGAVVCTTAFSRGPSGVALRASVRPCQVVRASGSTQQLHPGRYTLVVKDTSRTRYFSLTGPGIRKTTKARFVGTAKWVVALKKGTYRFRCGSAKTLRGTLPVA